LRRRRDDNSCLKGDEGALRVIVGDIQMNTVRQTRYNAALDKPGNKKALRVLLSIDKSKSLDEKLSEFYSLGYSRQDYEDLFYDLEHCPKKFMHEE
jgi:hypothetical protein